jgi:Uncharacterized protein conserved in bacteria (DUF2064)
MGSDIPDVDPAVLNAAFQALESHQLVLGPACDGGFYLIGATIAPPDFLQVCTVSMCSAPLPICNAGPPAALALKLLTASVCNTSVLRAGAEVEHRPCAA